MLSTFQSTCPPTVVVDDGLVVELPREAGGLVRRVVGLEDEELAERVGRHRPVAFGSVLAGAAPWSLRVLTRVRSVSPKLGIPGSSEAVPTPSRLPLPLRSRKPEPSSSVNHRRAGRCRRSTFLVAADRHLHEVEQSDLGLSRTR